MPRPSDYRALVRHPDLFSSPDWKARTKKEPKFRVGGLGPIMDKLSDLTLNEFVQAYNLGGKASGRQILLEESGWPEEIGFFSWQDSFSGNAARNVLHENKPVQFIKAVAALPSFEALTIERGNNLDVYEVADIIPCCYYIKGFDEDHLGRLRRDPDFNDRALQATAQDTAELWDELASGYCVSRETADGLRTFVNDEYPALSVGEVSVKPSNGLGKKRASYLETVDVFTQKPASSGKVAVATP